MIERIKQMRQNRNGRIWIKCIWEFLIPYTTFVTFLLLENICWQKTCFAVWHTGCFVVWSSGLTGRKHEKSRTVPCISKMTTCAEGPGADPTETHPGRSVDHWASWLAPGCRWDPNQKSSLAHSNPWGTCKARPRSEQQSQAHLLSLPTSQTVPRKPTLMEPTCLTPVWQRRHLWLECSRRGQSPGDCCGQLSWLRSYKCSELCRGKRKRWTFHSVNHSIAEPCWDRNSLPSAELSVASACSKYRLVSRIGNFGVYKNILLVLLTLWPTLAGLALWVAPQTGSSLQSRYAPKK